MFQTKFNKICLNVIIADYKVILKFYIQVYKNIFISINFYFIRFQFVIFSQESLSGVYKRNKNCLHKITAFSLNVITTISDDSYSNCFQFIFRILLQLFYNKTKNYKITVFIYSSVEEYFLPILK